MLEGLTSYFDYFTFRRPNQGLAEATPAEFYGAA